MSALCQKRTSEKLLNYLVGAGEKGRANLSDQHPWLHHGCTLAADIKRRDLNVGFVPIANIGANLKVYLVRWRRQTAGERVHPLMCFFSSSICRGEAVVGHGGHGIYCGDVTLRPKSTDDAGRRS
jgi:hypothetical protein